MEHETFLSKVNELSNSIAMKLAEKREREEKAIAKVHELNDVIQNLFKKFDFVGWEVRTKSGLTIVIDTIGIKTSVAYGNLTDEDLEDIQMSILKMLDNYYKDIS